MQSEGVFMNAGKPRCLATPHTPTLEEDKEEVVVMLCRLVGI